MAHYTNSLPYVCFTDGSRPFSRAWFHCIRSRRGDESQFSAAGQSLLTSAPAGAVFFERADRHMQSAFHQRSTPEPIARNLTHENSTLGETEL
jgi:hypothetical protein